MFLLPAAMTARGAQIAQGWAASLTMGAGQFCTNPGIAVVMTTQAQALADATLSALSAVGAQIMLTEGIAKAYAQGSDRLAGTPGVQGLLTQVCDRRHAKPQLFVVSGADWLADHALGEEVFGPLGLIVTAETEEEMLAIARSLQGQLTATLHLDSGDTGFAGRLLPILERKAGRLLANGYPTGVEVCDAMVHGGPYPASTNFGATSVGTMSIRRFLRPVSYQNMPVDLLPEDLQG
jgi:NADP-dependent aldehyde dehydrogenase